FRPLSPLVAAPGQPRLAVSTLDALSQSASDQNKSAITRLPQSSNRWLVKMRDGDTTSVPSSSCDRRSGAPPTSATHGCPRRAANRLPTLLCTPPRATRHRERPLRFATPDWHPGVPHRE